MKILQLLLKPLINLHGAASRWYLKRVYIPMVLAGQDVNKINCRLVQADFRETRLILEAMGARIHPTAYVETHLFIHNARPDYRNLQIGPGCYIGKDCFFDLSAPVLLEENVTIGMRTTILTHFNAGRSAAAEIYPVSAAPVHLEQGVYIGAGVMILPGVTVGRGAIVAAGAVMTSDAVAGTLVGGVPARQLHSVDLPELQK
jgi:acetyltransferase-like isoleucine patch superfamily enzyme